MKRTVMLFLVLMLFSSVALAGPFDLVAKRGMHGEVVSSIQMMLSDTGHYHGSIDGAFGDGTEFAVKAFQKKLGIPQDGIVTNDTIRLLKHFSKNSANELPSRYSRKLQMEATAYTTQDPGCGLYTARGNLLRKGLVAVDPSVIPLGTRLYIPGYGPAIADDTGGAIVGHKIDLAYESRNEALKFGRRVVTVYVID